MTITARPVVDKTGLPSTYTFKLDWTPAVGERGLPGPAPPDVAPLDSNGPSLLIALQEQLGLRLQSAKGCRESGDRESRRACRKLEHSPRFLRLPQGLHGS